MPDRARRWRTTRLAPYFPTFRAHPLLFQMLMSIGYQLGIRRYSAAGLRRARDRHRAPRLHGSARSCTAAAPGSSPRSLIALMPYHVVVTRQILLDGPMVLSRR